MEAIRALATVWFWTLAVVLLLVGPVQAEVSKITCTFPDRPGSLIMPEIVLRYDRASGRTTVEDKLIVKLDGGPKEANAEELYGNRAVIRTIYTWRIENIPVTTARWGFMEYEMRIEADGRAFIETIPAYSGIGAKMFSSKGRCL